MNQNHNMPPTTFEYGKMKIESTELKSFIPRLMLMYKFKLVIPNEHIFNFVKGLSKARDNFSPNLENKSNKPYNDSIITCVRAYVDKNEHLRKSLEDVRTYYNLTNHLHSGSNLTYSSIRDSYLNKLSDFLNNNVEKGLDEFIIGNLDDLLQIID